jgi:hypothetical protein
MSALAFASLHLFFQANMVFRFPLSGVKVWKVPLNAFTVHVDFKFPITRCNIKGRPLWSRV